MPKRTQTWRRSTSAGTSVRVDLLHLPHLGSTRNLSPEFLERVTADRYLFSGDGMHSNPSIASIAALIAARLGEIA